MLKGQEVFWTRIQPSMGVYDLIDLKLRTVTDEWFCGTDKTTKQAYLFDSSAIGDTVFMNRSDALKVIKRAEKNKHEVSNEIYYEEY